MEDCTGCRCTIVCSGVTADMLKDLGCEVVTAASGMDALERLSENANVDVLITDLNMPGMDGYELEGRPPPGPDCK